MIAACAWCGTHPNRRRNISRRAQPEGATSVVFCTTCGEFSLHTGVGTLRKPTTDEGRAIHATPEAQFVRGQWLQHAAGHPTPLFPKPQEPDRER